MNTLKNFINRNFREPVLFAEVARRLREGAKMVKVEYHSRLCSRYYTGTGNLMNSKSGDRMRWMVEVYRFDNDSTPLQFKYLGIPGVDATEDGELELLLGWDMSNVASISNVNFSSVSPEVIRSEITDIIRRLKPGQGYVHQNVLIEQDAIQKDGIKLGCPYSLPAIIPDKFLPSDLTFQNYKAGEPFKPEQVHVVDEKLIKRQHRPVKDLKRWVVVKQVPSVEDRWALKFTHPVTAGAPVFYYSVDINIDHKAMKGYPFYITELVNNALKQAREIHGDGYYDLDQTAITITWNGETKTLYNWLDHVRRFPSLLDEQPNVINKPLHGRANTGWSDEPKFEEI